MGKVLKSHFSKQNNLKKISKVNNKVDIIRKYFRALSNDYQSYTLKRIWKTRDKSKDEDELEKTDEVFLSGHCSQVLDETLWTAVNSEFQHNKRSLRIDQEARDLFHVDEQKVSNECNSSDWFFHICDEVSLEGLDGITEEGLWSRLENISTHPLLLHNNKDLFWNFIKHMKQITYYVLENRREKLLIVDRNQFVCPETGIVLEPIIEHDDIYPYAMVNADNVRGSCSTYKTRVENTDIIKNLNLNESQSIYGQRLIIVASQKMRENAIIAEISNPSTELMDNEYGLLERVGRARKFGELTQGKVSVLNIIKDSRSIFHLRKTLEKKKLLKKQFFILRNLLASQNKTGKLLHLPRFYKIHKGRTLLLIEEVVEFLRHKPNNSIEFGEFKKYFPRSTGIHKIIKSSEFNKYVKTNIFRPYRSLYPEAPITEWKYKNKDEEKLLRIFKLIDPTINIAAHWDASDNEQNSDEENDDDECPGNKMITPEFLKEVFLFIFSRGKAGVSLQELEKVIELDYYTIRMAIRKLQTKNVIDCVKSEHGKQRHTQYFARCFHSDKPRRPITKLSDIPDDILQKLIKPQKYDSQISMPFSTSTSQNGFAQTFENFENFQCTSFSNSSCIDTNDIDMSEHPEYMAFQSSAPCCLLLTHFDIVCKIHEFEKKRRRNLKVFTNLPSIITKFSDMNSCSKIVLLKSLLLGNNSNFLKLFEDLGTDNFDICEEMLPFDTSANDGQKSISKPYDSFSKDFLLGSSPCILLEANTSENINLTVIESTPPPEYVTELSTYNSLDKNDTSLSVFRANTILQLLNKNPIIHDIYRLQKIIIDIENETSTVNTGQGKIDKSTVNRLLLKLSKEGYLKIFKMILSSTEKFKTIWLVSHPKIDHTNSEFIKLQEQFLLKFVLGLGKTRKLPSKSQKILKQTNPLVSPFDINDTVSSLSKFLEISSTNVSHSYKANKTFGKILGFQPKFVRIQLFHELLFYLIYDYKPLEELSLADVESVLDYYRPNNLAKIPPIYRKTIDWKMFIPPLPCHNSWNTGWALLCDIILAIPLSIWVKIFPTALECPDLLIFMEHPIKRHYLIKDVPPDYRSVLMYKKNFLTSAIEVLYRMCFLGLIQFGPRCNQNKDQLFFYLNKRTSLLDTTTSAPSYHKITPKAYKNIDFYFSSKSAVDEYWSQLWTISMNTPLGQKRTVEDKPITFKNQTQKPELQNVVISKTNEQAVIEDTGQIPGDNKGAAGLDSSMWSHLKKNWFWSAKNTKHDSKFKLEDQSVRSESIARIRPISIKYRELMNQNRKIFLPKKQKKFTEFELRSKTEPERKTKIVYRKVVLKKNKIVLDQVDKRIMKRLGKLFRSTWNIREDQILLICKAAVNFLSKPTKESIPSNIIRDVLHILSPESVNKTSSSCSRRCTKLQKIDPVMKKIKYSSSNLINVTYISRYFWPIVFKINSSKNSYSNREITLAFIHLVYHMFKDINKIERILQGDLVSVDYFAPENKTSCLNSILVDCEKKYIIYSKSLQKNEIERNVIQSVLISFLNGSKPDKNTSYQLFKVCARYPDQLLRSAVLKLKSHQIISMKQKSKFINVGVKAMPFSLSIIYSNMQKFLLTPSILCDIFQHYIAMIKGSSKSLNSTKIFHRYARLLARNNLVSLWDKTRYSFNIPNSAYVLNPDVENCTNILKELAALYQQYLTRTIRETEVSNISNSNADNSKKEDIIPKPGVDRKNDIEITKLQTARLLMSLPYLRNKIISARFPLFMNAEEEVEIVDHMSVFLDMLIIIAVNLLASDDDAVDHLYDYIEKFRRRKLPIYTEIKRSKLKMDRVCHIIEHIMKNHDPVEVQECFDHVDVKTGDKCQQIINSWLNEVNINTRKEIYEKKTEKISDSSVFSDFYKYRKKKAHKLDNKSSDNCDILLSEIPDLDKIFREMLIPPNSDDRTVPHISELVYLLSKDRFYEFNKDDKLLEDLRNSLVIQYPTTETFTVENVSEFKKFMNNKYIFDLEKKSTLRSNIHEQFRIGSADENKMNEILKNCGANSWDMQLNKEIINYVYSRGISGISGEILKNTFSSKMENLSIEKMLEILTQTSVLLRTGLNEIIYVHNEFRSTWVVKTFQLSEDQIPETEEKTSQYLRNSESNEFLLVPWIRIDGTLNENLLQKWLNMVLSFCIDYPSSPLNNIFKRFYLIKPVDLFYLLETLQDLECVRIISYKTPSTSLFQERSISSSDPATGLENFNDMFVEVHTMSTTLMGFYLN